MFRVLCTSSWLSSLKYSRDEPCHMRNSLCITLVLCADTLSDVLVKRPGQSSLSYFYETFRVSSNQVHMPIVMDSSLQLPRRQHTHNNLNLHAQVSLWSIKIYSSGVTGTASLSLIIRSNFYPHKEENAQTGWPRFCGFFVVIEIKQQ